MRPRKTSELCAAALCEAVQASRFFDDFFQLADFLLDFPGNLFAKTFGFQVGIVRRSSNLLFNFTFHIVKRSFCFVLYALLHGSSPLTRSVCGSPLRLSLIHISEPTRLG